MISQIVKRGEEDHLQFWCEACNMHHAMAGMTVKLPELP